MRSFIRRTVGSPPPPSSTSALTRVTAFVTSLVLAALLLFEVGGGVTSTTSGGACITPPLRQLDSRAGRDDDVGGEFDAALLFRQVKFADAGLLDPATDVTGTHALLAHAQVSRECPKFVVVKQNVIAGAGHRFMQAIMAMWFAHLFGVTYVHTSLEDGVSSHESYAGWDAFLGSRIGENAYTASVVLAANGLVDLHAPGSGGFAQPNDALVRAWGERARDPALCNVVYTLPMDFWAYDIGHNTRATLAWKRHEALRLGIAPPLVGRSVFSPRTVAVAVHFRLEDVDGLPQRVGSATLTRIVVEEVLPSFTAAGISPGSVDVHVFTNQHNATATADVLGALADVPRVRVHGFESMNALGTMWHLLDADVTVGCRSSFSTIAGLVSLKPLFLQNSFVFYDDQRMRHCHEGAGCCDEAGVCTDATRYLLNKAALRIARSYSKRA